MNDLPTKLLFTLFLIIPAVGAWQYSKVYDQKTEPRQVSVSELHSSWPRTNEQLDLDRFVVLEAPVGWGRYEFVVVEASDFQPNTAFSAGLGSNINCELFDELIEPELESKVYVPQVILRRKKSLDGTLADRAVAGKIYGMISPKRMSWERAYKLELPVNELGPDSYWVVDVDRNYVDETLSGIVLATLYLSGAGIIGLLFVLNVIHNGRYKDSMRRNNTRAQVALQMAITRQEPSRY